MEKQNIIDIDEISKIQKRLQEINKSPLNEIILNVDEVKLKLHPELCDEWRFIGLGNFTLLTMVKEFFSDGMVFDILNKEEFKAICDDPSLNKNKDIIFVDILGDYKLSKYIKTMEVNDILVHHYLNYKFNVYSRVLTLSKIYPQKDYVHNCENINNITLDDSETLTYRFIVI